MYSKVVRGLFLVPWSRSPALPLGPQTSAGRFQLAGQAGACPAVPVPWWPGGPGQTHKGRRGSMCVVSPFDLRRRLVDLSTIFCFVDLSTHNFLSLITPLSPQHLDTHTSVQHYGAYPLGLTSPHPAPIDRNAYRFNFLRHLDRSQLASLRRTRTRRTRCTRRTRRISAAPAAPAMVQDKYIGLALAFSSSAAIG